MAVHVWSNNQTNTYQSEMNSVVQLNFPLGKAFKIYKDDIHHTPYSKMAAT